MATHYLDDDIRDFLKHRDICIIGFMGAGKSHLAELLLQELPSTLIDTDDIIERQTQLSISEIFQTRGEKYFRRLETNILKDLVYGDKKSPVIISTGGGIPISVGNRKLIKMLDSFNICLNPPFEVILSRVKGSKRPLIYRRSRASIFQLWSQRYLQYHKIAHISISDIDTLDIFRALNHRVRIYIETASKHDI
jgi:shikimate kinase